jgi:hypothetical protein
MLRIVMYRAQSMLSHMNRHDEEEGQELPAPQPAAAAGTAPPVAGRLLSQQGRSDQEDGGEARRKGGTGPPYECTECGATFRFQSSFLSHRKLHLKERGLTDQEAKSRWVFTEV